MTGKPSTDAQSSSATTKRDEILDAATRVFLDRGFDATSMDLVAQASGAARRTLYNQFESKENLFGAVIEHVWRSFPLIDITGDAEALKDPHAGLLRLGEAIAEFWAPNEAVSLLRMVIAEGIRVPALTQRFFETGKAPAMRAMVGYIQKLNDRKLLNIEDADLAAKQFMGMVNEPLLWLRVLGVARVHTARERKQVVESAVNMFLTYYGRSAATKR